MEVINKLHPQFRFTESAMQLGNNYLLFNSDASRLCGLQPGKYVHFLNEKAEWRFYVSENPDGFILCKNGEYLKIEHQGLCHMMRKSIGSGISQYLYPVEETKIIYQDYRVFEIDTTKPRRL